MKRTRLRPMSATRRRENRERRKALHARYGTDPPCALGPVLARLGISVCVGWACDGHELLSRARGGSIVDPDQILPACRPCHDWVTVHPIEAAQLGLARSRMAG